VLENINLKEATQKANEGLTTMGHANGLA